MKSRPEASAPGLDLGKKALLSSVAHRILHDLDAVASHVRSQLRIGKTQPPVTALAAGSNTMVVNQAVEKIATIFGITRSDLERLGREPFVARIVVEFQDGQKPEQEILYITRPSAAGIDIITGARFVTYYAPLGRFAALPVSTEISMQASGRVRHGVIRDRVRLRPDSSTGLWDGLDDRFEFEGWKVATPSLRRLLSEIELLDLPKEENVPDVLGALFQTSTEAVLLRERLRRRIIERITLRDQPILDNQQDEIFRLPLNERLVLLGPPGSGKTTTLIRRLAQKRMLEVLSEDERIALDRAGITDLSEYPRSWIMFTPTELLKLYIRDAFNDQGVPAAQENIQTWDRERVRLARNILGILRSGEQRGFQIDHDARILKDSPSTEAVDLSLEFFDYHRKAVAETLSNAYRRLTSADSPNARQELVRRAVGRLGPNDSVSLSMTARILEGMPEVQEEIRTLTLEIEADSRLMGNRMLRDHPTLLAELSHFGATLSEDSNSEDEDDDDDQEDAEVLDRNSSRGLSSEAAAQLLVGALRRLSAAVASGRGSVSGRAGRIIGFLNKRLPQDDALKKLGQKILTRADLRTLLRGARAFVMNARRNYSRFRREAQRNGRYYRDDANEAIRQQRISPAEIDVIILTMLRHVRMLLRETGWRMATSQDWLRKIISEYKCQVFVDEVTDFSPIQLACTLELSHPRLRSWFACGDLNQRITSYGVTTEADFNLIADDNERVEVRRIRIGYRQSPKLRELAAALCVDPLSAAIPNTDIEYDDVWPQLVEKYTKQQLALWLCERIIEIERAVGLLPSIAIFVDGEAQINELVHDLRPLLAARNLKVVGCADGRVVGDEQEVRVFDVQHIKGLEFEAVFFVGVDRLAVRLASLFDQYFYVGVSRAATYLGITCEQTLPKEVEKVRHHFRTDNWS
jgi:hypothetical protein